MWCMLCCMSGATRTQVYFTRELRDALDARAAADGKTMAQVVREAAGTYLAAEDGRTALPPTLAAELEAHASTTGRSVSDVLVAAVTAYLTSEQPNGEAVDRAMRDAFGTMPDLEVPPRSEWDRSDRWPDW